MAPHTFDEIKSNGLDNPAIAGLLNKYSNAFGFNLFAWSCTYRIIHFLSSLSLMNNHKNTINNNCLKQNACNKICNIFINNIFKN